MIMSIITSGKVVYVFQPIPKYCTITSEDHILTAGHMFPFDTDQSDTAISPHL